MVSFKWPLNSLPVYALIDEEMGWMTYHYRLKDVETLEQPA